MTSRRDQDAKKSPSKPRAHDPEQHEQAAPAEQDPRLDPESPGATIDSPTPAEPNEPA